MTETLGHDMQQTETAERPFLVREFVAADMAVEGRTVDVRLVPFGEVARVADPPAWEPYDEEWMPGVFGHQLAAANRIHARYGHSPHVMDVVGHGISLRSESDGYHVSAKIHRTPGGDIALELLNDGALPCVSLEARTIRSVRTVAGVVQRVKANLTGFAFCQQGAFAGAQVLAIRESQEVMIDEALMPVDIDPERVARLRAQGIVLPDRYKAHPAETGTPALAGTTDDGTRQTDDQHVIEGETE
jgi:HK97 family phage prohead protease